MARVIGAAALVLLVGSSAFGQFVVQPMKIEAAVWPNRQSATHLMIENLSETAVEKIDLRLVDITQDADGVWRTIEPDDTNAKALERSCRGWSRLEEESFDLSPLERKRMPLWVDVPVGKRGHYSCGVLASTRPRTGVLEGLTTDLAFLFLIPVIIEVQGQPMRNEVSLVDAGLKLEPPGFNMPAATYVTMKVRNTGGTYARLTGISHVYVKQGVHWRKVTETAFSERGILPGVTFTMKHDVGRPLPCGTYKAQAYLYVNDQQVDQHATVFEFEGDNRLREKEQSLEAASDMDPIQTTVSAAPGTMRQERMTVVNSSEESVNGQSLRDEQLAGTSWLRVEFLSPSSAIKLWQQSIHVFEGREDMAVQCNSDVVLSCSISANGNVPGRYMCWLSQTAVDSPGATVDVCAKLTEADLSRTPGGTSKIQVATVTVGVVSAD